MLQKYNQTSGIQAPWRDGKLCKDRAFEFLFFLDVYAVKEIWKVGLPNDLVVYFTMKRLKALSSVVLPHT